MFFFLLYEICYEPRFYNDNVCISLKCLHVRVWVQFNTARRSTLQNLAFSESDCWNRKHMKQIGLFFFSFFFASDNNKAKAQRQAWINGFKVKVDLEHPAGLIYPPAHPECGVEWQPTNHHHVCVFYMIKHMEGALYHSYLARQADSCKTPFHFAVHVLTGSVSI